VQSRSIKLEVCIALKREDQDCAELGRSRLR
jgi:hypothetical protein